MPALREPSASLSTRGWDRSVFLFEELGGERTSSLLRRAELWTGPVVLPVVLVVPVVYVPAWCAPCWWLWWVPVVPVVPVVVVSTRGYEKVS